ncbi:DoxX family protein [Nonlabens ponticola]|uniref:DoxX family protein n=1 Tax=Nonlabens ponticola TaxID=2496866 RepID=A0A3S9MZ12_9FLAO|nr:DoxX family protein [Nonlabens ponticola]AZQ44379.1 DoxX family protein [Nonlabens ponticola]
MDYSFLEILEIIFKLIVGLSILNVWLINRNKNSQFRAQDATNMREEFAVYGLSKSMMIIVGTIKCFCAVLLLISIFYPSVEWVGAAGIVLLMAVAISMHFKVGDPIKKSFPAALFLVLSLATIFI